MRLNLELCKLQGSLDAACEVKVQEAAALRLEDVSLKLLRGQLNSFAPLKKVMLNGLYKACMTLRCPRQAMEYHTRRVRKRTLPKLNLLGGLCRLH